MIRHSLDTVPEGTADRIVRWIAKGWSMTMIARELGWQLTFGYDYCRRLGIKLPGVAHTNARRRRGLVKAAVKLAVAVPSWVPDSLKGEYRDFAADLGEEEAARRVRRLKREMQEGQAA
ncbi:hypothetical protein Xaut_4522 [Xanthobacter versatilis]|uniref:Helix-turn-helix domain-containing protein n=1 Tax=Xanthobacter autotrophicus (strain ATCC BAA-1158 / Py2) TaxID=78245 RepID=A7INZ7_XANP2|nr:hypothetical protein Xaut_4522 [Xanthobacter autotrophicus Py2]